MGGESDNVMQHIIFRFEWASPYFQTKSAFLREGGSIGEYLLTWASDQCVFAIMLQLMVV